MTINIYQFEQTVSSNGSKAYEMYVLGTPWGRFDTKEQGVKWAECNLNSCGPEDVSIADQFAAAGEPLGDDEG